MTTTVKVLADTLARATGLDLQDVRRLASLWQRLVVPGAEGISREDFVGLYNGESAPDHAVVMTHAGLMALLPAAMSTKPLMGDKVRDVLWNYNAMERESPFALVRRWSGFPNNLLAAQLDEMKPGRLRELCRAQWCHHSEDPGLIAELACLGIWFGANALFIEARRSPGHLKVVTGEAGPCALPATA